MNNSFFSVRMRAARSGEHFSGAERIVAESDVSEAVAALTRRAMCRSRVPADEVCCNVERVDPAKISYAKLPDVSTHQVSNCQEGRQLACALLVRAGVRARIAVQGVKLLAGGAGPEGSVMRGAVIMDAATGERLEKDPARGVRVSRMDLAPSCRSAFEHELASAGLGHHRVLEALVLAGKVLGAPGLVAELCWSDDPEYTTGYVSDPIGGYQRISTMKVPGDQRGGRIFFVKSVDISLVEFTEYLEKQVVLFNVSGTIFPIAKGISVDERLAARA
jgi:6-carboxyhexanoate--CoA ligase